MKKLFILIMVFFVAGVVAACDTTPKYEIALITDHGPIDDKSFNQGAWEGVEAYAKDHKISYTYYRPAEDSGSARLDAIRLAVEAGAKIIVTPGFSFGEAVYQAQKEFPDVKFILLDAQPSKDGTTEVANNTLSIFYAEEQAGFLSGYAAVKEGFTKLGYMGGVSVPAVIRFGMGFIQGVEYAAKEMNVNVSVNYKYLMTFDALPANKTLATSWFKNDGVEMIFVAAGAAVNNAISAAEELQNKWVMGANVDQHDVSPLIISSSLKKLKESVYGALEDFYKGEFKGGQTVTLGAPENGVGITDNFTRFNNFTQEQYEAIYAKLASGEIIVNKNTSINIPNDLNLEKTTVNVQN